MKWTKFHERYQIILIFLRSFKAPLIASSNPILNYRDASYISTARGDAGKPWKYTFVVACKALLLRVTILNVYSFPILHSRMFNLSVKHERHLKNSDILRLVLDIECTASILWKKPSIRGVMLDLLEALDRNQVLSKESERTLLQLDERNADESLPLLLALQLWLWRIGSFVLSVYSMI